jgi:hypothetical protein
VRTFAPEIKRSEAGSTIYRIETTEMKHAAPLSENFLRGFCAGIAAPFSLLMFARPATRHYFHRSASIAAAWRAVGEAMSGAIAEERRRHDGSA